MTEDASAESKRPHRAEALVSFDGSPGRERFDDVLVYPKGLLLRTAALKPVGTFVDFDVQVAGEYQALRGRGMVVFSRSEDQGPRRPAGLGLRIEEVDEEGQALLERLFSASAQFELVPAAPPVPLRAMGQGGPAAARAADQVGAPGQETGQEPQPEPQHEHEEVSLVPLAEEPAPGATGPGAGGGPLPRTWSAGGWSAPPAAGAGAGAASGSVPAIEPSEDLTQRLATGTVSRRWLEPPPTPAPGDTYGRELAPSGAAPVPASAAAAAWEPAGRTEAPFDVAPPTMAAVTGGSHRARLAPWILVGLLLAGLAGGGYWAYERFLAAGPAPRPEAATAAPSREAAPPPGASAETAPSTSTATSTSTSAAAPPASPSTTLVEDLARPVTPSTDPRSAGVPPADAVDGAAPAAATAEPARPAPRTSPAGRPASRVTDIAWTRRGTALVVRVVADGGFPSSAVSRSRLSDPPREIVRLRGPLPAFPRANQTVGDALVRRVRTGLQANGDLQIVFDLADAGVAAGAPQPLDDGFEIVFDRRR